MNFTLSKSYWYSEIKYCCLYCSKTMGHSPQQHHHTAISLYYTSFWSFHVFSYIIRLMNMQKQHFHSCIIITFGELLSRSQSVLQTFSSLSILKQKCILFTIYFMMGQLNNQAICILIFHSWILRSLNGQKVSPREQILLKHLTMS